MQLEVDGQWWCWRENNPVKEDLEKKVTVHEA